MTKTSWILGIALLAAGCSGGVATSGVAADSPSTRGTTSALAGQATSTLANGVASASAASAATDPSAGATSGPDLHPEYVTIVPYVNAAVTYSGANPLSSSHFCSGVLISPRVALTTASCVAGAQSYTVSASGDPVGATNLNPTGTGYSHTISTYAFESHVYPGGQDLAVVILAEPLFLACENVVYPTLGNAIAAGAEVQLLARLGGLSEGVCTCSVPRGSPSEAYCLSYCEQTATGCAPEEIGDSAQTGEYEAGDPTRRYYMSAPVPVLTAGTSSAGLDYELPLSDGVVSQIMVLSHRRDISALGLCFDDASNFEQTYAYSDIGGAIYVAGTNTLVGIASTHDGSRVYAARTDVANAWLTQQIANAVPPGGSHLSNLSTRVLVEDGSKVAIAGLVIQGTGTKRVVFRALGPSLAAAGITAPLADPRLELHDSTGAIIATNDDWKSGPDVATLTSLSLAPGDDHEAALVATLAPGAYTAIVRGTASGVGLVEVYDEDVAAAPTSQLVNLSTRGEVGGGDQVMIGGFMIAGPAPMRVLLRGLPSFYNIPASQVPDLTAQDLLTGMTIELHDSTGAILDTNSTCTRTTNEPVFGGSLTLTDLVIEDDCLYRVLQPGAYTVVARGPYPAYDQLGLIEIDNYDVKVP